MIMKDDDQRGPSIKQQKRKQTNNDEIGLGRASRRAKINGTTHTQAQHNTYVEREGRESSPMPGIKRHVIVIIRTSIQKKSSSRVESKCVCVCVYKRHYILMYQ